jgi:hypothetical protein
MKPMNRRDALQVLGRGVVFSSLGLLTAVLASRAGSPPRGESPCSGGGQCGHCPSLEHCGLPRGLSAQRVLGKGQGS